MNKLIFACCCGVGVFFGYIGICMQPTIKDFYQQNSGLMAQNHQMQEELETKAALAQSPAIGLSAAFGQLVNAMRFLEEYSGTEMELSIADAKDNEDISRYFVASQYRGVRKLPVTIQVDKFSNETDMAAVLNDIHQLELETDFKIIEIKKDDNMLNVKGDIYGI